MSFSARVILDSVAPNGRRLTTMEWTYPRFIHAEFMTHRDRARNSASSRAIPFEQMVQTVSADPVVPLYWQQEGGGMQGSGDVPEALRPLALDIWKKAREDAATHAAALRNIEDTARSWLRYSVDEPFSPYMQYELTSEEHQAVKAWLMSLDRNRESYEPVKVHKTLPNRLVEPWMWITVLTTATEWSNLWRLRCHPDAEVHFQKIAGMAREAYEKSEPHWCGAGEWHLPLVTDVDEEQLMDEIEPGMGQEGGVPNLTDALCKISVARCARISYLTHEGKRDWRKDLELFDRLVQGSGFGHFSPHEHVAQAHPSALHRSGPFNGWMQYRKTFPLENTPG
jgi:hypothetical protein